MYIDRSAEIVVLLAAVGEVSEPTTDNPPLVPIHTSIKEAS